MLFVSCGTSLPQTAHETTAGLGGRDAARQQAAEQYFLGLKPRGGGTEPPHTGQLLPSLAFSPASPRTSHRLPSQSVFAKSSVWGRSQQIGQADRGARDNRHAVCPAHPPDGRPPYRGAAVAGQPHAPACGVWRVACGVWRVACGVWRVACGVWRVACGVWREKFSRHQLSK
jgi:hypothetical protein